MLVANEERKGRGALAIDLMHRLHLRRLPHACTRPMADIKHWAKHLWLP
jgi:hypothetical protein